MSGDRIFAPWRLNYIRSGGPDECFFCRAAASEPDTGDADAAGADHVITRGERCFVLLNAYPYTSGHLMVAPYEHVPSIEQLEPPALTELMTLSQRALAALRETHSPEGFNLGVNQGRVAGAAVEDHVHLHIVPRWGGDTNFMSTVGNARVLPQSLDETARELRERFAAAPAAERAAA